MTNDPVYVLMFEDLTMADECGPATVRPTEESPQLAALRIEMETEPAAVPRETDHTQPVTESARTAANTAAIDTSRSLAVAVEGRPAIPPPGTSASSEHPAEGVGQEQLQQRAQKMFCGGRQQLVAPGGPTLVSETSLELLTIVKAVITALFKAHEKQICSSPERPDLRLAQEEALGHLVGSLVVGELLAAEARPIGKRLDFHAAKEAKAQAAEKESVRQKKKGLRKKKGLEPAELASLCQTIDRDMTTAQAARLSAVIDLGLPDRRTVIVERRSPKASACEICPGCTRNLRSDPPTPLQARFGKPCECVWGPDPEPDDPQPTSKGAVARVHAELTKWGRFPEAGMAVAIGDQLENLYTWLDDEYPLRKPITQEQIDAQTLKYKLALQRLKAAVPEDMVSPEDRVLAFETLEPRMADERNSMPCPYGFGRIVRWPWALHLFPLGFCYDECRCEVVREARLKVVMDSLGEWPDHVLIREIW